MRRAAAVLALVALAGCGHGDGKKAAPKVTPSPTSRARSSTERALESLRRSGMPADARKELEEAARLLDESR